MTDTKAPERKKTPAEQEKELDKQLQESFPASDVPAGCSRVAACTSSIPKTKTEQETKPNRNFSPF